MIESGSNRDAAAAPTDRGDEDGEPDTRMHRSRLGHTESDNSAGDMPRRDRLHSMTDFVSLPPDLPVPVDDGAAKHLTGLEVPDLTFDSTQGPLALVGSSLWTILYVYPRTGGPGIELPDDWDLIPGARGCTPQSCAFRDHFAELAQLGAAVRGVGSQPLEEQLEFAERMHIPFPLINDTDMRLAADPLRLPVYRELGLYKRLTLAIRAGRIEKVWYPVFPPDRNAFDVVSFLRTVATGAAK